MKTAFLTFFTFLLSSMIGIASAQTAPDPNTPDGLIKMIVADVMASVKADPEIQKAIFRASWIWLKRKLFLTPICAEPRN